VVCAVIITGGPSDFCLNYSLNVVKLTLALHYTSEGLLSANAVDAIVGFDGKEHDKKKNSLKQAPDDDGTDIQKLVKLHKKT
jgi:hypothetical protein